MVLQYCHTERLEQVHMPMVSHSICMIATHEEDAAASIYLMVVSPQCEADTGVGML